MTETLTWTPTVAPSALEQYGVAQAIVGGTKIALYAVDGDYYATADLCTHGQASLADGYLDGDLIECPLHQGTFNVKTGAAVGAPCTVAVRTYPVKLENGVLHVGMES
ncbi:non-heme iron oxygenase ferredoxin subunit [Brevundimonas intermedia]|uniref:non-heme iron oxygenase ferredoxin subunit n=1 Tax=Brevundimonas intermedia TaxID=74315 RepID=UPI00320A3594